MNDGLSNKKIGNDIFNIYDAMSKVKKGKVLYKDHITSYFMCNYRVIHNWTSTYFCTH